jgi:hypothetical protein
MSLIKLLRNLRKDNHKYAPLPGDNFIRILDLQPGSGKDQLHCKLKAEPYEEVENTYEAISYAWGDLRSTGTEQIICNNMRLTIGKNLADALRRCRDKKISRRLWADAVCIDQADDPEKGHQVRLMGQIYENAKQVLIWLGPDSTGCAEDVFNLISETVQYLNDGVNLDYLESPHDINYVGIDNLDCICTDMNRWKQVRYMVSLPWFNRLWVSLIW